MKIFCPHCNAKLEAPDELLGEIVDCPECNNEISIPTEDPVKPPPPPPDLTENKYPSLKVCTACGEDVNYFAQKCKHCGEFFNAPKQNTPERRMNPALYGCVACLIVGGVINFISNFLFIFYIPLYFAGFVLAIVAISQGKALNGIMGLILSIIFPGVICSINIALGANVISEAIEKNKNKDLVTTESDIQEKPAVKPFLNVTPVSKPKLTYQPPKPQIAGAFGIKLGSYFDTNNAIETTKLTNGEKMYKVNAPKRVQKFKDYYVLVTPGSKKIYSIWAQADFEGQEAAREFPVVKSLIDKKYNINGKDDLFGDSCSWNIGDCNIYLKKSTFMGSSLEIRYTNNKLEKQAKQEFIKQETSRTDDSAF